MRAIAAAVARGTLEAELAVVIADRPCPAISWAEEQGYATEILDPQSARDREDWDRRLAALLKDYEVDLVILAGFLKKIGPAVLGAFAGRILNIHPSLLPRYGGPGYYGLKPHQAALAAGDRETGATVHYVNQNYDEGEIILQRRLSIDPGMSAEEVQDKVLREIEWKIYPEAIQMVLDQWEEKK